MTSSPPGRTLHCYRHDQAYVGQCERCVTEMYRMQGPAAREIRTVEEEKTAHQAERPKLSVEQVHAELRKLADLGYGNNHFSARAKELIDQLPRPDLLRECCLAFHSETEAKSENFVDAMNRRPDVEPLLEKAVAAALRRYLELKRLPSDPDLEGK